MATERTRQRTQAIGSVLKSVSSTVIVSVALLMIISVLQIPITPILASVSAVGVAVGLGARDLITELRRRPPVWATRARAWVVQPHTAKDLIALAEQRGYDIVVTTETELPAAPETPDAPAEAVLW